MGKFKRIVGSRVEGSWFVGFTGTYVGFRIVVSFRFFLVGKTSGRFRLRFRCRAGAADFVSGFLSF